MLPRVYAGLVVVFVVAFTLWMHARGKRVHFPADVDPLFVLLIAIGSYLELCIYGSDHRRRHRGEELPLVASPQRPGKLSFHAYNAGQTIAA